MAVDEFSVCLQDTNTVVSIVPHNGYRFIVETSLDDVSRTTYRRFDPFTHKYGERKELDERIPLEMFVDCPYERQRAAGVRLQKHGGVSSAKYIEIECAMSEPASYKWLRDMSIIPAIRVPDVCRMFALKLEAVSPRMHDKGLRLS